MVAKDGAPYLTLPWANLNPFHTSGASTILLAALALHILLIRLLRAHRLRISLHQRFPHLTTRQSFSSMTLDDAFLIQQSIAELEFPFTFQKALQFALFRTYGIPSISRLLIATTQFTDPATATKRYVDTEVLVAEFAGYHPKSDRAIEAIARMNFIHSAYQRSGKISNDDMLYTLSLFALEPLRWIGRYEWRQLTELEKCALGTFWKAMGDAMDINYGGSLQSADEGWTDGLHWLEEVEEWAEGYEQRAMVPDVDNHRTAEQTTEILLWYVPSWAKGTGRKVVTALMDDRLRTAMMYEKPSKAYFALVAVIFGVRKFCVRNFFPPRPAFLRHKNTSLMPDPSGKYPFRLMDAAPWYIKPTLWNRYGPYALVTRIMGLPLPGDEGDKYFPSGYTTQDVGPKSMRGKGMEFAKESKERILKARMGACPFVRVKAE